MSTCAVMFVVIWLLGSVSSLTAGGFIHLFPVVAIGMMLPRVLLGRKVTE